MNLLQDINFESNEAEYSSTILSESLKLVSEKSELLRGVPQRLFVESAVSYLAGIINQVESQNVLDLETSTDVLTVLSVLSDPDTREAIHDHVNPKQFSIIVRHLGDHEKVANFIKQQARIPSLATIRQNIKKKLTSIRDTDDRNQTIVSLRKLRMAYEQIQTQLQQQHSSNKAPAKK
jgi:hypothetical protein